VKAPWLAHPALLRRLRSQIEPLGAEVVTRRRFLKISGVGGLALGFACGGDDGGQEPDPAQVPTGAAGAGGAPTTGQPNLPEPGPTTETSECAAPAQPLPEGATWDVNAFVRIGADDSITLFCMKSDMGQGVLTSLAMLLAEELDVDWEKVRAEHPVTTAGKYNINGVGQFTAGSSSIPQMFTPMRQMGAAARQMLISAAAQTWGVQAGTCTTELGVVVHAESNRRLRYAEVAELAGTLPAPQNPTLKSTPFRLIGTARAQLSARAKASGTAQYTLDVQVPGMLVGLVARSPSIGGGVAAFDATAALAVPGVRQVVPITSGVAVLADHYWAALKGREALNVTWMAGPNAALTTASLRETLRAVLPNGTEQVTPVQGDAATVVAASASPLDVEYELPYLAHAPLEPLNAVAHVKADNTAEIWAGTQGPDGVAQQIGGLLGIPATNVTVHVPFMGGSFGRRGANDFVVDAVEASRAAGNIPVKLVYSREDDMRSANYRPMNYNRLRAVLGNDGLPSAWIHDIAVQGIFGAAFFAIEGAATNFPYAIANRSVRWSNPPITIPVFTWRSVGASHNAFVVESFIDELADRAAIDPLEYRLRLLANSTAPDAARHARALQDVANRAGWTETPPTGRARGIAVHQTFGTIVAEVAEVSIESGALRVHRVWATVDCGQPVNTAGIAQQCEGGIIFGMSAVLYGQVEFDAGRPVQGNFDTYRLVRFSEAPEIDVAVLPSTDAPITGMGEPGVSPLAPAVCNALFRLTGQRVRKLPIQLES
jgi:isoquinoline 1-oxidoreductase subunit beta